MPGTPLTPTLPSRSSRSLASVSIMWAATRISFCLSCCAAPTTAPASITVNRLLPGPVPLTLAALALLDPQQHALGVDVAGLERDDLGDAQSGAVGGGMPPCTSAPAPPGAAA